MDEYEQAGFFDVLALAALAMWRRRPKTHQDAFTRGAVK